MSLSILDWILDNQLMYPMIKTFILHYDCQFNELND